MASKLILAVACIALALSVCLAYPGGLDDELEADEGVKGVVNSVLRELSHRHRYARVEPISYRRQVVSGYNYFVKARAFKEDGSRSIVHLRIYQPFGGPIELTSIKHDVHESHKLEYF